MKNLLTYSFLIYLLLVTQGCSKIQETIIDVKEMKADLTSINANLDIIPMGKMEVYPKDDNSSVRFGYKPKDIKSFTENLHSAANKSGYVVSEKVTLGGWTDEKILLMLCSNKRKYRFLSASVFKDGTVSVGIYENKTKPIFGERHCSSKVSN